MCAIAGLWMTEPTEAGALAAWARAMTDAMVHRGPHGDGVWCAPEQGLALAHRRLAIRDTGPSAAQPMVDPTQGRVLVFNGEIDNHRAWRDELARGGCRMGHHHPGLNTVQHSTGDTEVLLHALSAWGADRVCERAQGMWAWGLFERDAHRLTLSRDRLGKKPLYWVQGDWGMAFASQLQALRQLPMLQLRINPRGLAHYLRWGYIEGPESILEGVHRVEPGQTLVFEQGRCVDRRQHWSVDSAVARGLDARLPSAAQAQEQLNDTLRLAVADRLQADVPVGAYLSGGIDSALVVALMQEQRTDTRSFCIGFDDPDHDESAAAQSMAAVLGTRHETARVDGQAARALLPTLARIMDEPLADASLIPTTLLSQWASQSVRVVLTGDGGDEAFGGYARYRSPHPFMRMLAALPAPLRMALAQTLKSISPAVWALAVRGLPPHVRPTLPASKADKLARWLRAADAGQRMQVGLMRWNPSHLWPDAPQDAPHPATVQRWQGLAGNVGDQLAASEAMQRLEMGHYLSGDLLAKMDRASMWASVEARSPLLDHRVIELAWRMPASLKAEGPRLKEVLRRSLEHHVPRTLFDRPKRGFTPPMARWLRHECKAPAQDLMDSLLDHTRHRWNTDAMRRAWQGQQAGTRHEVDRIWTLITLELWRREWKLDLP